MTSKWEQKWERWKQANREVVPSNAGKIVLSSVRNDVWLEQS